MLLKLHNPSEEGLSPERDLENAFNLSIELFNSLKQVTVLNPDEKSAVLDLGLIIQNILQQNVIQIKGTRGNDSLKANNQDLLAHAANCLRARS